MSKKLVKPDYKNCIANVPNSILKKFGVKTVGDTLPLMDEYLKKDYKNVVLFLLDGMGKSIIEEHLEADGAFRKNLAGIYNSVFLSTTVAATTSAISGLQPCEHSWLGWDCYYPIVDKNVTVFLNTVQGTDEPAADYPVASTYNPYESVVDMINAAGGNAYNCMPFMPPFPQTVEAICENIKELCKKPEAKYIYAYWKEPDGIMHKYGCKSVQAKECVQYLEKVVSEMAQELEDTLIVITADHGHIDTEGVVISDYPKICDCLVRLPALEPRVMTFFVKDGRQEEFEYEFKKEFGDKFILMTVEEALDQKLFGTGAHHKNMRGMLGDYIAVATDELSIFFDDDVLKSMHGSLTEEEMLIPFIVFERK